MSTDSPVSQPRTLFLSRSVTFTSTPRWHRADHNNAKELTSSHETRQEQQLPKLSPNLTSLNRPLED